MPLRWHSHSVLGHSSDSRQTRASGRQVFRNPLTQKSISMGACTVPITAECLMGCAATRSEITEAPETVPLVMTNRSEGLEDASRLHSVRAERLSPTLAPCIQTSLVPSTSLRSHLRSHHHGPPSLSTRFLSSPTILLRNICRKIRGDRATVETLYRCSCHGAMAGATGSSSPSPSRLPCLVNRIFSDQDQSISLAGRKFEW